MFSPCNMQARWVSLESRGCVDPAILLCDIAFKICCEINSKPSCHRQGLEVALTDLRVYERTQAGWPRLKPQTKERSCAESAVLL